MRHDIRILCFLFLYKQAKKWSYDFNHYALYKGDCNVSFFLLHSNTLFLFDDSWSSQKNKINTIYNFVDNTCPFFTYLFFFFFMHHVRHCTLVFLWFNILKVTECEILYIINKNNLFKRKINFRNLKWFLFIFNKLFLLPNEYKFVSEKSIFCSFHLKMSVVIEVSFEDYLT